ncbi:DUF2958 domain-containing protein [Novosphingobium sp. KACC 22771]|uniref:DUF2958 domain-containing protein n=1 Tax=Novosphingobium sp. KACC 22771 TaxID=3025670 RepID=UPI00236738B4|nr:DUF2958 domain-containing protein [Novosphingobium sp. KACC 22771]WDF71338.1 DUF2958 domain-containing protein [Novosphingobium sp. KACC 22771]
MTLLPERIRVALLVNAARHRVARNCIELGDDLPEPDPVPLLKLFNPCGAATWLASELDEDGDTLFGLADLGFGCPELGSFSLREIAAVRLPFGLRIERDHDFASRHPLSLWAQSARQLGSITQAEIALHLIGI